MKRLIAEYWAWIVVPIVLVVGVLALFLVLTEHDPAEGFIYNL